MKIENWIAYKQGGAQPDLADVTSYFWNTGEMDLYLLALFFFPNPIYTCLWLQLPLLLNKYSLN